MGERGAWLRSPIGYETSRPVPWTQLLEEGEADAVGRIAYQVERVERRILGVDVEGLRRLIQADANASAHAIALGRAALALGIEELLDLWAVGWSRTQC